MEEKEIIKIHSILEGKKKFFHALCIVKWQWRIVVGRYPMTAIKLHGCSRCTVAIVLRSALSFPHTPYLEQNNLGIFLNIKKNTFECHIDWGCFVSYVPIHKRTSKKSINLMPKNANSKVLKIIIRLFWSREKVCLGIALCSKFRSCTFTTNCTLLDFEQYWFLKFSWIRRKAFDVSWSTHWCGTSKLTE